VLFLWQGGRAPRGRFVFHREGRPIKSFRTAWKLACTRAGLEGRLVHDLRRTAARDFRRQGASEGEIMKLCGWKTRAMFDRYNIIDEIDLAQAVAKRFNDKVTAKSSTPARDGASLSCSPASSAA
jgi:integrase